MIRALSGPRLPVIAFAAACLAVFAINVAIDGDAEFVLSDGAGYYAWARSLFFDRDVRFANEFAAAPWPTDSDLHGIDGGPLNKFSVGLSILEFVPIALATLFVEPLWPGASVRGYGGAHMLTLAVLLLTAGVSAIGVALRQVRRDRGPRAAALAAWALVGATGLIEFGSRLISYTHLTDVALVLVLWWLAHRPSDHPARHALLGGLAGLAATVRMTNVVILPWIVAWAVYRGHRGTRAGVLAAGLAGALPLAAQAAANRLHRGDWLPEPYPGERFTWLSPRLGETLWSFEGGWLTWHPIYAVLLAALLFSWTSFKDTGAGRAVWWTAVGAVAAQIWINASWWAWQGGGMQFGNRLFFALSPMLVVMAVYGTRLAAWRVAPLVLAGLVAWNGYLFAGVSVAKLQGNWKLELGDALGWESHVISAIQERWSQERD